MFRNWCDPSSSGYPLTASFHRYSANGTAAKADSGKYVAATESRWYFAVHHLFNSESRKRTADGRILCSTCRCQRNQDRSRLGYRTGSRSSVVAESRSRRWLLLLPYRKNGISHVFKMKGSLSCFFLCLVIQ